MLQRFGRPCWSAGSPAQPSLESYRPDPTSRRSVLERRLTGSTVVGVIPPGSNLSAVRVGAQAHRLNRCWSHTARIQPLGGPCWSAGSPAQPLLESYRPDPTSRRSVLERRLTGSTVVGVIPPGSNLSAVRVGVKHHDSKCRWSHTTSVQQVRPNRWSAGLWVKPGWSPRAGCAR